MYRCDGVSVTKESPMENSESLNSLFTKKYAAISARAHQLLRRERSNHTLQTNALVHEAYVRMIGANNSESPVNPDLLPISVGIMRKVLVDHARKKRSQKRGGDWKRVEFHDDIRPESAIDNKTIDILALDDALEKLAKLDPMQASIVEQRYFSGMTIEQTARELGLSPATVKRKWIVAQAWLYRELQSS